MPCISPAENARITPPKSAAKEREILPWRQEAVFATAKALQTVAKGQIGPFGCVSKPAPREINSPGLPDYSATKSLQHLGGE